MEAKGTMLLDYVRIIRANKDKDWDKWLEPQDWEIINERILPSRWYPYESFQRIGLAVFKEIAGSNLDTVRGFGRFTAKGMGQVYKNLRVEGDPAASAEKFAKIRETFLKDVDGGTQVTDRGPTWLKFKLTLPSGVKDHETGDAFGYQIAGILEEIVELAGGKNVSLSIEKTEDGYEYDVKWE